MATRKKHTGTFPVRVSGKQLATALSAVAKASQQLASVQPMNTAERKHVVKLKVGTSLVVPTITVLIEKYGLQTEHVSMDESSSLLTYASSLRPLVGPVEALLQTIKDEILRSEANAWTSLSVSYGMLQKVAVAVPALATELAGVQAWFRHGHTAKAAPTPAPAPPPAASVNPPPQA